MQAAPGRNARRSLFKPATGSGLVAAAFLTHLRVNKPVFKMLPALALLVFATLIAWINYRLLMG